MENRGIIRLKSLIYLILFGLCLLSLPVIAQDDKPLEQSAKMKRPVLSKAVTCEGVKDHAPVNECVVFSIEIGKVHCFTVYDPVPEKTFIYHKWIHRDTPNAIIKLVLNPPRWSTFSNIQLRESDKGPWRVEIVDIEGNIYDVLRFSITE